MNIESIEGINFKGISLVKKIYIGNEKIRN
jgi:hypothetical protein